MNASSIKQSSCSSLSLMLHEMLVVNVNHHGSAMEFEKSSEQETRVKNLLNFIEKFCRSDFCAVVKFPKKICLRSLA